MTDKPNILIINDGNRRWAKAKGLSIETGYEQMVRTIAHTCDDLFERGFKGVYVTFCTVDNLQRLTSEVDSFYSQYLLVS